MPTEHVDLTVDDDGVATLALDRPEKLNALSAAINRGIDEGLDRIAENPDARSVVLRGNGDAFCAGGDVAGMGDRDPDSVPGHERAREISQGASRAAGRLAEFHLPTIAVVDGYCFGAGMGLALACDVVLTSESTMFSLAFRNVGLTLDYGTSYFVTEAVGPYRAKELALTGERFSGERAGDMGLVNHAYPDEDFEDEVADFVETVASGPTVALGYSMRNIDRAADRTLAEAIEAESEAQVLASGTRDHREGVEAFAEDREPEFEGR